MPRSRTGHLYYRPTIGWGARVTVDCEGERLQKVVDLGTHDRQVAKRRLSRWHAEQRQGAPVALETAAAEESVEQYATAWLSSREAAGIVMVRDERIYLTRHVYPEIGTLALSAVKPANVRAVLDAAIAKGLRRNTVAHLRALLHRLFRAAFVDELIRENPVDRAPMPRMRETRKERCVLTDAEFAQYMASPAGTLELKLMALVARIEGGMRTSDVIRWDWSHLDRVHFAECIIPRSKTGAPQALAIPPVVGEAMRMRWERAGRPETGPVFPVQRGPRLGEMRATRGVSFARRLRRDLLRAGVRRHEDAARDPLYVETATTLPVDFHSFRRAFASALADAGVNVQTAMRLASHSDEKVHMRYVGRTAAMRQIPEAAIPRLPEHLFESASPVQIPSDLYPKSPSFPAPPTGLGPVAFGLGNRGADGKAQQCAAMRVPRSEPLPPLLGCGRLECSNPMQIQTEAFAADIALDIALRGAAERLAGRVA